MITLEIFPAWISLSPLTLVITSPTTNLINPSGVEESAVCALTLTVINEQIKTINKLTFFKVCLKNWLEIENSGMANKSQKIEVTPYFKGL